MKRQLTYLMLVSMVISGSMASAKSLMPSKKSMQVDFNRMIHEGELAKRNLHEKFDGRAQLEPADIDVEEQRQEVIDFVDVEIGLGSDPEPVVDRRFDSVDAPRIGEEKGS